ncbi:uncharacterized protein LOC133351728 isoform X2 [Lethenteron reissneri]|uniref:uncharacterized protein LOC133351728 isoform X2 n=1 Tax=Lethenteron reissneri TaxID=7753 RepID=UPI002AB79D34|nr:uncharacterized protein LOC133351728 isoform X2 [Lethenteron reissneri]
MLVNPLLDEGLRQAVLFVGGYATILHHAGRCRLVKAGRSAARQEYSTTMDVLDDQRNFRILPNTDEMRHHVLKQDKASVCLFRKAVAELYAAAFQAEGTHRFMGNREAKKNHDTFHSFVRPSCGTTQEGEQDATFKEIMARLADAKLKIPSDEAMLRKVLRETELLPIACTERADREKPSGGRRGGGGDGGGGGKRKPGAKKQRGGKQQRHGGEKRRRKSRQ